MLKKFSVILFSILLTIPLFAQQTPSGGSQPEEVITRLSYENFQNIKFLAVPIMNFGNGKEQFDQLVSTYAKATALHFNKEEIEAMKTFEKNEDEIQKVAMDLAKVYKERAGEMQKELIEYNVKLQINLELQGETVNDSALLALNQATQALLKANDFLERGKPLEAIKYFRIAKEKTLAYYEILYKSDPEKYKEKYEEIMKKYEKDIQDNQNKKYEEKEKKN